MVAYFGALATWALQIPPGKVVRKRVAASCKHHGYQSTMLLDAFLLESVPFHGCPKLGTCNTSSTALHFTIHDNDSCRVSLKFHGHLKAVSHQLLLCWRIQMPNKKVTWSSHATLFEWLTPHNAHRMFLGGLACYLQRVIKAAAWLASFFFFLHEFINDSMDLTTEHGVFYFKSTEFNVLFGLSLQGQCQLFKQLLTVFTFVFVLAEQLTNKMRWQNIRSMQCNWLSIHPRLHFGWIIQSQESASFPSMKSV